MLAEAGPRKVESGKPALLDLPNLKSVVEVDIQAKREVIGSQFEALSCEPDEEPDHVHV
jgi:hypothetical protein